MMLVTWYANYSKVIRKIFTILFIVAASAAVGWNIFQQGMLASACNLYK